MSSQADFSGFHRRPVAERRALVAAHAAHDLPALQAALHAGGLTTEQADKLIENVLGTYALPFAVAVHVRINGRNRLAPMVVEEPSVVAAASGACKLVASAGGFRAEADAPVMIAQVQVHHVPDLEHARHAISQQRAELVEAANRVIPRLVARGGGARDIEIRSPAPDMLVVHVLVDCRDAMGANIVNTVAEALGPRIAELAGGTLGLRILSNLADRRCVRSRCQVPAGLLATAGLDGALVAQGIEEASRFAEVDPYRAATHNKGIMNGIDPVVIATGNDWRAVEAGAHAYAARSGSYGPLATWRRCSTDKGLALEGRIELPMALGIVGGTSGLHPGAQAALALAQVQDAADLAMLAACVGLASNLAALRALATEGIQRGHMSLHARSLALAAGAKGEEVELVAASMAAKRDISASAAQRELDALRKGAAEPR